MTKAKKWAIGMKEVLEMSEFVYTVVVSADNKEQAEQVMRERLDHDEDYGFDYTLRHRQKGC